MDPSKPVIRTVNFEEDGSVAIDYMVPESDAKSNGLLLNHTLFIPVGSDYDDEIEDATTAVADLLADALEDLAVVKPVEFDTQDKEDSWDDEDEDEEEDE